MGKQQDYSSNVIDQENQLKIGNQRLISRNSKVDAKLQGPTLKFMDLLEFMEKGDIEHFKNLLTIYPDLNLQSRSDGKNILMIAICNERELFAKFLLENNSNNEINLIAIDREKNSSLLLATRKNYINIIKLLIEKDSSIMQDTLNWKLAFIEACEHKNWDIAVYILNNFKFKDKDKKYISPILEEALDIIQDLDDDSDKCKEIRFLIENKLKEFKL